MPRCQRSSDGPSAVGAAVDIGSNSVHLLVAAVTADDMEPLVDESVFLGLGEGHRRARLPRADRHAAELAAALATYTQTARGLGARAVTFIGTEPIRRAADAARIVAEVVEATGAPFHVARMRRRRSST